MNPKTIEKLLELADRTERNRYDPWVPFSLRWIAWEALRTRIIVIACRFRGWKMEDAYNVIGRKRISSNEAFKKCLKLILGRSPFPLPNGSPRQAWDVLQKIELVRHRLFHGYKTVNPEIIIAASKFLSKLLRNHEIIFGSIEAQYGKGISHRIGDVLIRNPSAGKKIPIKRSVSELKKVVGIRKEFSQTKPIPSIREAAKWIEIFK